MLDETKATEFELIMEGLISAVKGLREGTVRRKYWTVSARFRLFQLRKGWKLWKLKQRMQNFFWMKR